ncbi:SCO family protein [Bacillus sp. JJ722]|uniref:SCO family protein n=1 Tax=Bacillus sp. JJ722 TaxID=3122973 RepID=UPI002FFE3006
MKKIYTICAIILVIGIGSGIYYFTEYRQSKMTFPEDVTLQTHTGEDFAFANLPKKIRLVEFMYTYCPDICPNTTYQMQQLRDQLVKDKVFGNKVEFLTVSFDPARDTQQVLQDYAKTFEIDKESGWFLVSGENSAVKELADSFNFQYRDPGTGEFIHSSATYLLDEENKVIEVFGMGEKDFKKKEVYKTIMNEL